MHRSRDNRFGSYIHSMKKLIAGIVALFLIPAFANAAITFPVNGGTGSSTLSGIILGNGTSPVQTLKLGTGLTLTSGTLSSSGGSGGSGNVSTSTGETAGQLAYWTSTNGTPALLGKVATTSLGVTAPFTFSGTLGAQVGGVGGSFGCTLASSGVTGCLSGTDWTTFNGKQAAGNYITALTGDVTASGPGSVAATLATVNSNVGTFTYPSVTVNGKGLVTAIANGTAPTTYTAFTPISISAGNVIAIATSSASQSGFLSAADFSLLHTATTTFSSPLVYTLGTNAVTCSTCLTANQSITLTGDVTGSGSTAITTAFNLANTHWWTARQNFTNASSSQLEATSSLRLSYLTGASAGNFIAVDPNGYVIATSSPSGSNSAFSPSANFATTGALPSNTYNNGTAGVGATITEVGTGALSVDGSSPAAGQRVLVKNEATAANNGLYLVTAAGSGIAAFILTRDTQYNTSSNIIPGEITYVISGSTNDDDFWALTSAAPLTIGTTALNYTEVSGGGANVTSVSNSDGTLTVSPTAGNVVASLALAHANSWTGQQTFGTSAPVFSTMTLGSVFFAGTSGLLSQDNSNFFWDATNHSLGIASTTPKFAQVSIGASATRPAFAVWGASSSTPSFIISSLNNSGNVGYGTTTPWADISIENDTTDPGFVVSSSNGSVLDLEVDTNGKVIAPNASTTNLTFTTGWATTLGTPAGAFLAVDPNGKIISTTTPSGSGSGTVTSVTASTPSSTLTLGGTNPVTTSGTISFDINLTNPNSWTGKQTFANASTTLGTVTGTQWYSSITSSLLSTDANGLVSGLAPQGNLSIASGKLNFQDSDILALQAMGSTIKAQTIGLTPSIITTSISLTTNQVRYFAVYLPQAVTLTGAKWYQQTAGNFTANNYNGIGLYTYSAGTLTWVASTTDSSGAIWKATTGTYSSANFASSYSAQPGLYFLAFIYNESAQTTAPAVAGAATLINNAGPTNAPVVDLTNSAKFNGTIGTQNTLPVTQAMSGVSTNSSIPWGAIF